jgi:YidC/Oxa1 family membrane protein insertase
MISSATTAFVLALLAPVQWIVDLLHPVLLFLHDTGGVGWGTSIVLLTVVVRALLAPLTIKQFKSMQAMVRVAPQLKELQAKHKGDKQRQQQEVMKFYAEHKINPFASCLPLVAQMPFFIGLFYLLQTDLRREICGPAALVHAVKKVPCADVPGAIHGVEDFLFIPDLTVKATGWVLIVLIVLYVSSQLLSSVLTPSTADRTQKMIMYALPFIFVVFVQTFPAGLIVYWITTNLWTVSQGYLLRRRMGPISAPKGGVAKLPAASGASAAGGGRGGGFMAKLAAVTSSAAEGKGSEAEETASRGGSPGPKPRAAKAKARTPAAASAGAGGGAKSSGATARAAKSPAAAEPAAKPARTGPPPPPPRKKKKRSGRRR